MKLYIKNMVCGRCEMAVKVLAEEMGIPVVSVQLGEIILSRDLKENEKKLFDKKLQSIGFELLSDRNSKTIELIKSLIIDLIYYKNDLLNANLSTYLRENLNQDYSALSSLFSETEGITIEHYFIAQKIERVKELLTYNELTLSEIAFQLNYSTVSHLSNQFKKVTGFTPTNFKKLKAVKRKQIDLL
jgi:AraC-like DNA-binding protein